MCDRSSTYVYILTFIVNDNILQHHRRSTIVSFSTCTLGDYPNTSTLGKSLMTDVNMALFSKITLKRDLMNLVITLPCYNVYCICVNAYVCIKRAHVCIYIYIYIYIYTCAHMYVCMYVYMCAYVCMYICAHMHVCMYIWV